MPRPRVERGAGVVYTRSWVADLILDLVGYRSSADLGSGTIVEPGCGDGAFLRRIVPRLVSSAKTHGREFKSLDAAVRAYELDPKVAAMARIAVIDTLIGEDVPEGVARYLAYSWVLAQDFLLVPIGTKAKWVVGNPPYVRVEDTTPEVYAEYRKHWKAMSGRADVYVGFYEAGLSILEVGGQLCFICADRWMHNQYGAGLRRHIIDKFALRAVIEVHDVDVFDVPVAAYPAITLIERAAHTTTALATTNPTFGVDEASRLVQWCDSGDPEIVSDLSFSASILEGQFKSDASWPSGPPERLRLITDLEGRLPSLAEVGVVVGVGMATGADKVFIVKDPGGVEPQFVKTAIGPADFRDGGVCWIGRFIISPWIGSSLADLERFPGLRTHLEENREVLKARYVAKSQPGAWWRTIDRPPAGEYSGHKLVVADLHDRIEPVLDTQGRWPLHSAYYITSAEWGLEALGGYLLSDIAGAFVEAYSVKMANGHLRISGQYLKKVRLPAFKDVKLHDRTALVEAFRKRDRRGASQAVRRILSLQPQMVGPS